MIVATCNHPPPLHYLYALYALIYVCRICNVSYLFRVFNIYINKVVGFIEISKSYE